VLSGGERKRCSIGVELVADPSIVLLDEPTSGLDSFKATSICALLSKLAKNKGKTILATIHSPSSESFFYFDRLILLADGYVAYQGDAKASIQHFKMINLPVPRFANPADYFMKVLSVKYPKTKEDDDKLEHLNRNYRTLLEGPIRAEMKLINLPVPVDFKAGQGK
jgi:ABC-type multidrug transport system ATPase subunit